MSQENVEVVRAAYAAMAARDVRRVSEYLRPDVEWIPDRRVEGPIRGREKVIEFCRVSWTRSTRSLPGSTADT
jgi:ketosteroid isomerase-like protein